MTILNADKPTAESEPNSARNAYQAGGDAWRKNRPVGFLVMGVMLLIVGLARHSLSSGLIAFAVCEAASAIAWKSSRSE